MHRAHPFLDILFGSVTPTNALTASKAEVLTSGNVLLSASDDNKDMLLDLFAEVRPRGSTNFEDVSLPGVGGTGTNQRSFRFPMQGRALVCPARLFFAKGACGAEDLVRIQG